MSNGKVSGTPSILLTPVWITKANYKTLFKEGFLKKRQVLRRRLQEVLQVKVRQSVEAPARGRLRL